jgi:23S rRNA (guanosine2251-2'-O)-methyltransferase
MRRNRERKLLGSHQKCWLWGRNVVVETLCAGKWPVLELWLADRLPPDARRVAVELAARAETPVSVEPYDKLTSRCRSAEHQGYLAKMPPFPYDDVADVLRRESPCPLYLMLDSIQDPHNFGAIVRSADVLSAEGIIVRDRDQAEVTSAVARSSAGAVNNVPLARVDDLTACARELQQQKIQVLGTRVDAQTKIFECDFCRPTAVVLGNEGEGIGDDLLAACDHIVTIPCRGKVDSLNVAACAGIVLYEAMRQRSATGT